jgi:predicted component of type VI protein secretion system
LLKRLCVLACLFVSLLAVSGCSAAPVNLLSKPTPSPTPTAVAANDDAALEAAARAVINAMALVNYKDPTPWKTALLGLSNDDGKKFWQANFDNMLKDVVAHKRIAEKVTVQQVIVAGRQTMTDAQGKTRADAIVLVTGTMDYSDDQGEHTNVPLSQPMLFANLDGQWQFVEFVPPSALATPTPSQK